jgi:hypothetical protein
MSEIRRSSVGYPGWKMASGVPGEMRELGLICIGAHS